MVESPRSACVTAAGSRRLVLREARGPEARRQEQPPGSLAFAAASDSPAFTQSGRGSSVVWTVLDERREAVLSSPRSSAWDRAAAGFEDAQPEVEEHQRPSPAAIDGRRSRHSGVTAPEPESASASVSGRGGTRLFFRHEARIPGSPRASAPRQLLREPRVHARDRLRCRVVPGLERQQQLLLRRYHGYAAYIDASGGQVVVVAPASSGRSTARER